MKIPEMPENEAVRSQVLQNLDLLYSPSEERFDSITRIAKRLFNVPIALVSLVSKDKQWFKSCQGLTVSETNREISFCGHAILNDDIFVIPNASKDPDFSNNPLVIDEPKIRFYAGCPLHYEGYRIGTLCIIDQRPRHLKPQDYDSLKCLSGWLEQELRLWKNEKSYFVEQFMTLEDREALYDGVIGDINEQGVEKLRETIQDTDVVQKEAWQIKTKILNFPKDLAEQSINLLRKTVAQGIRSAISDSGVVGSMGQDGFVIFVAKLSQQEAIKLKEKIKEQVSMFVTEETDLTISKVELEMDLVAL